VVRRRGAAQRALARAPKLTTATPKAPLVVTKAATTEISNYYNMIK